MIYLLTGQPGHGKTLRGLQMALEERTKGRMVYAHGTPGLDHAKTKFLDLPDPRLWQDLPDNSVIFIDECYTVFPNRSANSVVPRHVEALARHRHRGFDFILVCQLGNQIDPFLRGLVDKHTHVRRKFGFNVSVLKEWDHYQSDPLKMDGSNRTWRLPKDVMKGGYYHSTTQDTTKKRLPWYFIAAPIILGYVGYVFWKASNGGLFGSDDPVPAAVAPTGQAGALSSAQQAPPVEKKVLTAEEWAQQQVPRVPDAPWSAPIFDGRKVASEPMVACMSSEESCSCMTEQATRYTLPEERCREIARYGPVYNPFLRENRNQRSDGAGYTRDENLQRRRQLTGPRPGMDEPNVGGDLEPVEALPEVAPGDADSTKQINAGVG